MASSLTDRLAGLHPKMLRAESESQKRAGETESKKLADLRPFIGKLVERALELLGITKQDAAFRMGYSDAGTISRWCSGTERPALDKLFAIDGFRVALVLALAECTEELEAETVVRVPRRKIA